MTAVASRVSEAVALAVGASVAGVTPLGGGDVALSFRVRLVDGREVFAKTHHHPPPEFFVTEAVGLTWLREPEVVPVPEVLAVSDGGGPGGEGPLALLVLEWVDESRHTEPDEVAFGRALAALHLAGAPCYGREDRRPTGSRGLPNDPCDTWVEFYAERRLLPVARLARDGAALTPGTVDRIERLAGRLDQLGAHDELPARLHGDLWAGNRLVDRTGTSWLIDPAAHGGHREYDLAMMRLFGGFSPLAFAAYDELHPLAEGWQERVPLHQLVPLAVHAVKFGGGYPAATERALDQLGA